MIITLYIVLGVIAYLAIAIITTRFFYSPQRCENDPDLDTMVRFYIMVGMVWPATILATLLVGFCLLVYKIFRKIFRVTILRLYCRLAFGTNDIPKAPEPEYDPELGHISEL